MPAARVGTCERGRRVGVGYDIHRLVPGKSLVLGGVPVPADHGFDTHSDGDVLSHAVIDALAGALADGDLGTRFPKDDPAADMPAAWTSSSSSWRPYGSWLPGVVAG